MIAACMKRQVITVTAAMTVHEAARLVVAHRIGTLPVIDGQGILIGVVRLDDLLRVFMPGFVALMEDIDFVHDFGALESLLPADVPEAERLTVRDLMQPPIAVEENCGLLRAYATMLKHDLRDLPVVNARGVLSGLVSQVDIAAAFLGAWSKSGPPS